MGFKGVRSLHSRVVWIPYYNIILDNGRLFSIDAYFLGALHRVNRGLLVRAFEDNTEMVEPGEEDLVLEPNVLDAERAVDLLFEGYEYTRNVYVEFMSDKRFKPRISPFSLLKTLILGFKHSIENKESLALLGELRAALILYEELFPDMERPEIDDSELFWRPYIVKYTGGKALFYDASLERPELDKFYNKLQELDEGMERATGKLLRRLSSSTQNNVGPHRDEVSESRPEV